MTTKHTPHIPVTTLIRHRAGFITTNGKWFIRKGSDNHPFTWFAFERDANGELRHETQHKFDTYGAAKYFVTHERNN